MHTKREFAVQIDGRQYISLLKRIPFSDIILIFLVFNTEKKMRECFTITFCQVIFTSYNMTFRHHDPVSGSVLEVNFT